MVKWIGITGFDGYEISETGDCRSRKSAKVRLLKPRYLRGYVRYSLYDERHVPHDKLAHRLVWEAHVSPIPKGLEINHKNGIKDDNRLSNLEILTHDENMAHRKNTLQIKGVRGSKSNLAKLTEDDVLRVYELLDAGLSQSAIAKEFGISRPNVSMIQNGKTWPHLFENR